MQDVKTRDLSTLEYVRVLEEEWWVNNLRRKIYPGFKDKKRFSRISSLKKARIIEISERNELPHIFNDNDMMRELNKRYSVNGGCPVFPDRNEEDVINYYNINSDVRCFYGFNEDNKPIIKIGKIVGFDQLGGTVEVNTDNSNLEHLPIKDVTRIF